MKKALKIFIIVVLCAGCLWLLYSLLIEAGKGKPIKRPVETYQSDPGSQATDVLLSDDEVMTLGGKIAQASQCVYITINELRITTTGPNAGGCSPEFFFQVQEVPAIPENDPYGTMYNIAAEIKARNLESERNLYNLKELISRSSCTKDTLASFAPDMPQPFESLSCLGNVKVYESQSYPL